MEKVTVVILSNAIGDLIGVTQEAIDSCEKTCDAEILVIEQSDIRWEGCKTLTMKEQFNYNKFANLGISMCDSDYVVVSNNDVIFTDGWLEELLKYKFLHLVSPKDPNDKRQKDILSPSIGDKCGRNLSGWCFMISREHWLKIGGLDEEFPFWCADNSLIDQSISVGVTPCLIPKSIVYHKGSMTLKGVDNKDEITLGQVKKYNTKYNKNLFKMGKE